MTATGPGCPRCGSPLRPQRRAAASGSAGAVEVTVPPRTLGVCPDGHRSDAETVAVRTALGAVPTARRRRRLGRSGTPDRCGACDTALDLPPRRTVRGVTVEGTTGPPYLLELVLPLVRCPDCAVDNVPSDVVGDVHRAVRSALG